MIEESSLTAALLCGSAVKWLIMPILEWLAPVVRSYRYGKKRALVLVLCALTSPIYLHWSGFADWLMLSFSSALVAIGQHHLIKWDREK